ncbi:RNA-dependent ATPase rok1 [Tieghemiomyces parasiticus]|uniref:RNA helicase n=1 Tax=Tieghemiomyces parasiticus TaxID=78921 RepID=A0A9W8AF57_9FUNG|nr:RNA-dependent ATPase rok1 [Tieghemiomyces parasiticus]
MDFFKALGSGIKFDRKKFQRDIQLFEKPTGGPASLNAGANCEPGAELDFFAEAKPVAKANPAEETNDGDDAAKSEEEEADALEPFHGPSEVQAFRDQHRIAYYGELSVEPVRSFAMLFERFTFKAAVRRNFDRLKFTKPTPIQLQALPLALAQQDFVACAPTGSGKTLAYVLPMLHILSEPQRVGYRACIVTPTRELATQVYELLKVLSQGTKFRINHLVKARPTQEGKETDQVKKYDILISTPLRLMYEIEHDLIDLSQVQYLVLDEADQLLELGYLQQVDTILAACTHSGLRKQLFSATIPPEIEDLAQSIMRDPVRLFIGFRNAATEDVEQRLVFVGQEAGKMVEIRNMVQRGFAPPVLIFVQSIDRAKELFHELVYDGLNVDVIHSQRTKAQRDNVIANFRAGRIWVLIATELMSRGIDFKGVNLVINYDFPQTVQSYIHRVGRTGRAGRKGIAVTYFTREDAPYLRSVVNVIRDSGGEVPEWMLELKPATEEKSKLLKIRPPPRQPIITKPSAVKWKMAQLK